MPEFTHATPVPAPAERVWRHLTAPGALLRLLPPWSEAEVERADPVADGARVIMRIPLLPGLRRRWIAEHRIDGPMAFTDTQMDGPFAQWTHVHRVEPAGSGCVVHDRIAWRSPCGMEPLIGGRVRRELTRLLRWRAGRLVADTAGPLPAPQRIAVSGATGLVGRDLCARLRTLGYTVLPLQRRSAAEPGIAWDPQRGTIDTAALATCDAVVHLAGETVAQRWTPAARAAIRASRVEGTALLARTLAGLAGRGPRVLVCASGISFGGSTGDTEVDESVAPGAGLLPEVVAAWEAAAAPARAAGIRTVHLRIGVVLDPRGGALAAMLPAAAAGLGGPVGGGAMWLPWIALDDLVGMAVAALDQSTWHGPINAVAPAPVRQGDFARTLGRVLHRPAFLPAPLPLLRLAYGREMVAGTLLASVRAVPARARALGFAWQWPELQPALAAMLGR